MPIELDATVPRPKPDATATASRHHAAMADAAVECAVAPGIRLAHFRVERPLGHGGMGEVWLATDLALDRAVALKLLPSAVAGDAARRDRLIREARAQARLNHPNVCHIYFIGEEDGRLFFAMEHVAGETLAQRLDRGPLAPDQAIELARQAALGLREAHRAGFTHRDVKPSNLMIDGNGVLKVMDFGLVSASPEREVDGDDAAPTSATSVVGTPLYMAPEQGRGEAVDLRADIYALGATLHHMISGTPPFAGDSAAELQSRHESGTRAPLAIGRARRSVRLVDEVIATMMATRPSARYASYDALVEALDHASSVRTRSAGFWARAGATVINMIVFGLIGVPFQLFMNNMGSNAIRVAVAMLGGPLLIARFGATPGHALLDLEIARHRGRGRPSLKMAMIRMIVCYGPVFVAMGLNDLGHDGVPLIGDVADLIILVAIGLPLGSAAWTSWRTVDKRTYWDVASGTRVRYRARDVEAAA